MKSKKISILGCGWLGFPLGQLLVANGFEVKGSTTSDEKLSHLQNAGIEPFKISLPVDFAIETDFFSSDILVLSFPPGLRRNSEESYLEKIGSIIKAARKAKLKKIINISSTAIYPSINRVVIEEDADVQSVHFQAEELIKDYCNKNGIAFISARCGGLMGYDRYPCKYIKEGESVSNGDHSVNYIHQDDVIAALYRMILEDLQGIFNLVAPIHPLRKDVYQKCASKKGLQEPTFVEKGDGWKTVSSKKFIAATGFEFKYPNPLNFDY